MRALTIILLAGALLAPVAAQNRGNAQWGGIPSVSVRRSEGERFHPSVPAILGWRIAARSGAFGKLSFHDAAAKVDAAGLI
jgi:hypothetical protein